ncbi:LysR family transcriptional regulator [Vibrio rumoiensis]|uniref:LysR family transcriptional regulator n=1 Tax=Vibrio rumoiensis TaxID=76258 RepID=UPI003AA8D359
MDIDDLRVLVEVADAGGVASGARRLGLAKSIVSRRLTRLENTIGVQVLSRTTKGSVLTEAGATFRDHALKIIAELETAQEAISPDGVLMGRFRIAAPQSLGVSQLAPLIAKLAQRHPQLEIDTHYSDRFVDLVGEGFDCSIRLGILPDSNLIARRICSFKAYMVASPEYLATHGKPKNLEELSHHQAIIKKGEIWKVIDNGKLVNLCPKGRFTSDNGEAVLAAALSGIGVAGLPDFLVGQYLENGQLVPILTNYNIPELGMFIVRPAGSAPNRKVNELANVLIEHFGC